MKFLRDVGANVIAQLYDLLQAEQPRRIEKSRTLVVMGYGNIPERILRRHVIAHFVEDVRVYRCLREVERLAVQRRPEPRCSSPLERIKSRTAILNQTGELTGGNFRAAR